MRRLMVGVVLVLALAGCTSPPAAVPAPTSASVNDVEVLGAVRANLCKASAPEPWDVCVDEARRYLSLALQIHDEMVAAGTATSDMATTAADMGALLKRCAPPNPTESNTQECTYTFDTIRSTGLTFQQQIVDALGS